MTSDSSEGKKIVLDADEASYDQGYSDASARCAKYQPETYLSYAQKEFIQIAMGLVPVFLILLAVVLLTRRGRKEHRAMNQTVIDRQKQGLEFMQETNRLLAEISLKLDKK